MADPIRREVGKDGKILLTNAPAPSAKRSNPSLDELDALLAATSGDAANARRKQWTPIEGEGPAPSLQPAYEALKSSAGLQQLLDLEKRSNPYNGEPYASDIPTAEEASLEQMSTPGGIALRALDMASIPGSLFPSPLQPAAAAWQAGRGVQQAVQDPSLMNTAMAGVMALPLAGAARRFMPKAAKPTGAGAKGPFSPLNARPQAKPVAPPQASAGGNMRRVGLLPFDEAAAPNQSLAAVDDVIEQGAGLPRGLKESIKEEAERLERGIVGNLQGGLRTERRGQSPNRDELGGLLPDLGKRTGRDRRGRMPQRPSPILSGAQSAFPPKLGGRAGDVHEAQSTGGMFGFDDLGEISEAELRRLQGRF